MREVIFRRVSSQVGVQVGGVLTSYHIGNKAWTTRRSDWILPRRWVGGPEYWGSP